LASDQFNTESTELFSVASVLNLISPYNQLKENHLLRCHRLAVHACERVLHLFSFLALTGAMIEVCETAQDERRVGLQAARGFVLRNGFVVVAHALGQGGGVHTT